VPKMVNFFADSQFRERFESEGRLARYLADIPTCVITRPIPGPRWRSLVAQARLRKHALVRQSRSRRVPNGK
jgi:glucokinase